MKDETQEIMLVYDESIAEEYRREQKAKQMEIEGGGHSWWWVCPECHGAIDRGDHFCRHCGQAVME